MWAIKIKVTIFGITFPVPVKVEEFSTELSYSCSWGIRKQEFYDPVSVPHPWRSPRFKYFLAKESKPRPLRSDFEEFEKWFSDSITRGQHFVINVDDKDYVDTRCGLFLLSEDSYAFMRVPRGTLPTLLDIFNEILGTNWENHYERRKTLEDMYWESYYEEKQWEEALANIDPNWKNDDDWGPL
ncbi:MAG: hypothetical protein OXG10_01820 [Candidatus Dadabacteria bacterium]|nr:hypothetical protein [Candidatus Dadabacteria bacterium]